MNPLLTQHKLLKDWLFNTKHKIQFNRKKKKKNLKLVSFTLCLYNSGAILEKQYSKMKKKRQSKRKISPITLKKLSVFYLLGAFPPLNPSVNYFFKDQSILPIEAVHH